MKQRVFRYAICIGTFCVFLSAPYAALYFTSGIHETRHHIRELATAPDLRDIASDCIRLLQTAAPKAVIVRSGADELPSAIRSKKPASVYIDATRQIVTIEFGGGFFHYGYRFEPLTSTSTQARLLIFAEDQADRELLRL